MLLSSHLYLLPKSVFCRNRTTNTDTRSTLGLAAKQPNNKKENPHYLSLHQQTQSHTVSLQITHTLSMFTHPLLPNMLVRSLFCAGWSQTGQRAFSGVRHFWESLSSSVTLRKEAHGMLIPLETAGFSPALSVLSLTLSLVLYLPGPGASGLTHDTHFRSNIRKPLAQATCCRQVWAGGCWVQGAGSSLWFVCSCWFMRCK